MAGLEDKKLGNWIVWVIVSFLLFLYFPTIFLGIDSFFYRDFGALAYPIIQYQRESFLSGEIPLWNPLSHCGIPFLAQWGTMTLYPLSLFYFFLPLPWSLNMFCFLHLILGAAGMYVLSLRWVKNNASALFSAVAYVFNGVTLSCLMWPNYTAALAWLPWIVSSSETAIFSKTKHIPFAIIFTVFQLLAGVPEIFLFTQILVIATVICRYVSTKPSFIRVITRYLFIILIALLIGSSQLLPFVDLLLQSQRAGDIDFAKWSMPGWGFANFFVPLFHYFKTYQGTFVQFEQAFVTSYYFPLGMLALAIIGFTKVNMKSKVFFLTLIFFSLSMAPGLNSFFYKIIVQYLPFFNKIRYPVKFIVFLAFIIPILSGFGLNSLLKHPEITKKNTMIVFVIFCAIGATTLLYNWKYPFPMDQLNDTYVNTIVRYALFTIFIISLIAIPIFPRYYYSLLITGMVIISFDAATHMPRFHPRISSEHFKSYLWQHSFEKNKPSFGKCRIFISPAAEEKLLGSTVSDWTANFIGKRLAYWSNLNLLEQIPKVNGAFTLQLSYQKAIEKALYYTNNINIDGMLKYLNVGWVTRLGTIVEWAQFTNSMPLITGGQRIKILNKKAIIDYLCSTSFNPAEEIIFESAQTNELTDVASLKKSNFIIHSANLRNHKIEIEYECDTPSIVSIAQSYYKAWRLKIDNKQYPLIRANYAFQAFITPAGRHRADIYYYDLHFIYGIILTYAGFLFLITTIAVLKILKKDTN